jgi:3-deoxy-manno-octulosonate cytidylyltransferase (CMP-KDO synthetase)
MRAIGIIPARFQSSRFPGKPLADILGKSMIERVYLQAQSCHLLEAVYVATDDERIATEVERFGGQVVMTSPELESGTERCAEVLQQIEQPEVVVNIQGDEPYISAEQMGLILSCFHDENTEIATLVKLIERQEVLLDPNKVKVIMDEDDFAIYFSRQVIPYMRDLPQEQWLNEFNYYKHIGMYAYRSETLSELMALKPSRLERAEGLEQLRWIEHGYRIKTAITEEEAFSVDTPEDLEELQRIKREE